MISACIKVSVSNKMDEAKELFRRTVKKFKKRKIITRGIDDLWAADLLVLRQYSRKNKGYKYILTVIDTFSKYLFLEPLKTKTGKEVTEAFKKIIKQSKRKPNLLHVDKGKEFVNKDFKKMLEKKHIIMYHTENAEKSAIAERANRTINEKLKLYFHIQKNYEWISLLKHITDEYNNKDIHRTIGMPPAKVNKKNEDEIYCRIYNLNSFKLEKPKFKIGDIVRITINKGIFDSKYTRNWTREKFVITKVHYTDPITYSIKDENGENVVGKFYKQELLLTRLPV